VLEGTFGPKREAVTGGWRTLHNEELHDCTRYESELFEADEMTGHVACMAENT
jgi:hypothetical protein